MSGERFKVIFLCLSKHLKMECLQGSINHKCSSSLSTLLGRASFLGHVFLLPHSLGMGQYHLCLHLIRLPPLSLFTHEMQSSNKGLKIYLIPSSHEQLGQNSPHVDNYFLRLYSIMHIQYYIISTCLRLFPLVNKAKQT